MLGRIVQLQLGRIKKRVEERYKIPFEVDDAVIQLVVSRCTESESGGRMIDAILTNTMLPDISREFLQRMMEGKAIEIQLRRPWPTPINGRSACTLRTQCAPCRPHQRGSGRGGSEPA
jgi:ATP-dependent Clp protease ATP-binding subunit ClpA